MHRRTTLAATGSLVIAPLAAPGLLMNTANAQTAPAAAPTAQAPGFYRFKLGSFTVTTVHDGFGSRPVEGFVVNKPLPEVQRAFANCFLPTDTMTVPYTITVVDTGRALVVFDTGNGAGRIPTAGQFLTNLRASGLDPARVTHVVLSHFHGDHVGGLLDGDKATFPNAELVVTETEWKFWTDASNETRSPQGQRANFANVAQRFAPYQNRIRRIADNGEALPGIRAVPAHGHTPGHTCFTIADGNDQLMFVADTTNRPNPLARNPDFHIIFDFDPAAAEQTRRRIYDQVTADRMRVTGFHFPFPSTGFMEKDGVGYRFAPSEWSAAV